MRLGYFTMPVHPATRSPTDTLREDREIIILADVLGYYDAFVCEHLTDLIENITNTKCVDCGDLLTDWETTGYCIICEPDEYEV